MRCPSLLASVALLVLAGCGGTETDQASSPLERLGRAAAATDEQDSVRFTMIATMESRDLVDEPIPLTAEGVMTTADEPDGVMTMDLAELFRIVIGSEIDDPDERELVEKLFGDPEGWQAEMRFLGEDTYMRIPALTNLVGGKPWVALDDDDAPESGLDVVFGASPTEFLRYVRAAGNVEELGPKQVGGRSTVGYRADVDLEQLAEQHPKLRERLERTIEATGQRTVPIEVWVDEDDLIRRVEFTDVTPPGEDEEHPTTFTATMDFPEYGIDVEVEEPPADDVMSEDEFDRLGEE